MNETDGAPDPKLNQPSANVNANARKLSRDEVRQRQKAALKHGAYATEYGARLRQRRLRDRVGTLLKTEPGLKDKPRHLVQRYVEVDALVAMLWNVLFTEGVVNAEGEPKRLLTDYRHLINELSRLAAALGLLSPDDGADPMAAALLRGNGR